MDYYKERLGLKGSTFSLIDHDDAMVAIVYKITKPDGTQLILKICNRIGDYLREVYFLKYFAGILPVPVIRQVVEPEKDIHGAVLMDCLPGNLLKLGDFTDALAYELGSLLARIHLNHASGYGDLVYRESLSQDPRVHFTLKFEEGLEECSGHLPKILLEQCKGYFNRHVDLLEGTDGPCMVHRDFRAGNVMVHHGKIQGIIDWSSGRGGFAEEDFCPMEHEEWPNYSARKRDFLEGYASVRPIPNYGAVMPLLRLSKAIGTIGFTVKRGTWENIHARIYQFNRQFIDNFPF